MTCLQEIALVKNHVDANDHLKRMIKNEESSKRQGWEERIQEIE